MKLNWYLLLNEKWAFHIHKTRLTVSFLSFSFQWLFILATLFHFHQLINRKIKDLGLANDSAEWGNPWSMSSTYDIESQANWCSWPSISTFRNNDVNGIHWFNNLLQASLILWCCSYTNVEFSYYSSSNK